MSSPPTIEDKRAQPAAPTPLQHMLRRDRRPGDFIASVAIFALSAMLCVAIPFQTQWYGDLALVANPAFWPTLGIGLMLVCSLANLIISRLSARQAGRRAEIRRWFASLEFVGWFLGYVLVVPFVGYLPSSILFVVALMLRLGCRRRRDLLIGMAVAVLIVVVFKSLLAVNIPGGAVYEFLPAGIRSFFLSNL